MLRVCRSIRKNLQKEPYRYLFYKKRDKICCGWEIHKDLESYHLQIYERDTKRYIDQLEKFVSIINNRINLLTKLATIELSQKDVPYLIYPCITVSPQRPKLKVGDRVRIRKEIETYMIQFAEELFTISHLPTKNPPTYFVKDVNDEIIQVKFYEPELVKLVTTNWTRT